MPALERIAEDELVRLAGVVQLDQVAAEVDRQAADVRDRDRLVAPRLHLQAHATGQRVAARHHARVGLRRAQVALRVEQVGAVAHRAEAGGDVLERGLAQAPVLLEVACGAAADAHAQRAPGRDDGGVREPVAGHVVLPVAQPGVAHPPAPEGQVAPAAVVDVDPLAVEVLRVVAVRVPVDGHGDRQVLVGPGTARRRVVEARARGRGALGQHEVLAVVGVLDVVGQPEREPGLQLELGQVPPAAALAHPDGAPQTLVGVAREPLGGEPDAAARALDRPLDERGGLQPVAGPAAAARVLRVARQLHRVDAGEADRLRAARKGHADRVAVGDEAHPGVGEDAAGCFAPSAQGARRVAAPASAASVAASITPARIESPLRIGARIVARHGLERQEQREPEQRRRDDVERPRPHRVQQ